MNKPHKHAEAIKAWADGAEIEFRFGELYKWEPVTSPGWDIHTQYRIKPQPKVVKKYTFYDRIERTLENNRNLDNMLPQMWHKENVANEPMVEWTFTDNKLTNITLVGQENATN